MGYNKLNEKIKAALDDYYLQDIEDHTLKDMLNRIRHFIFILGRNRRIRKVRRSVKK